MIGLTADETNWGDIRIGFDRRLKLQCHGSRITCDARLLPFRDIDDVLGLAGAAAATLSDVSTDKSDRNSLVAQFRQSPFGRVAEYEDVNDAYRLVRDPAVRWIVGGRAVANHSASTRQTARFEAEVLMPDENPSTLTDLSERWIDAAYSSCITKAVVQNLDSSVSRSSGRRRFSCCAGEGNLRSKKWFH